MHNDPFVQVVATSGYLNKAQRSYVEAQYAVLNLQARWLTALTRTPEAPTLRSFPAKRGQGKLEAWVQRGQLWTKQHMSDGSQHIECLGNPTNGEVEAWLKSRLVW